MKNITAGLVKAETVLDQVDKWLDTMAAELQARDEPLPSGLEEFQTEVEELRSTLTGIHEAVMALTPEARRWQIFLLSEGGIVYINRLGEMDTVSLDLAAMLVNGRIPVGGLDDLGAYVRFNLPSGAVVLQKSLAVALAGDTYATGLKSEVNDASGDEQGGGAC